MVEIILSDAEIETLIELRHTDYLEEYNANKGKKQVTDHIWSQIAKRVNPDLTGPEAYNKYKSLMKSFSKNLRKAQTVGDDRIVWKHYKFMRQYMPVPVKSSISSEAVSVRKNPRRAAVDNNKSAHNQINKENIPYKENEQSKNIIKMAVRQNIKEESSVDTFDQTEVIAVMERRIVRIAKDVRSINEKLNRIVQFFDDINKEED